MAARMKIRSDDTRQGHLGQGQRQDRRCCASSPSAQRVSSRAEHQKRHQPPGRFGHASAPGVGGVIEVEGPIHVSNVQLLDPKERQPDARRHQAQRTAAACASPSSPGRRSTDARHRGQDHAAPEGRATSEEIAPELTRAVRLREPDAGPAAGEDHAEHGRGRGQAEHQAARRGRGAARHDRRAAAQHPPRAQVDRRRSSCARGCPSAARSRCAAPACGSSSTG